jgi:hypothetical protein
MALGLALLVFILYIPSARFGFFSIDDSSYVAQNKMVIDGITWKGVVNAFHNPANGMMWGPMNWLSFMADTDIYGFNPGGFHTTNTIIHLFNSLLFFAFLYRATGSPWKSLLAAALWAVHPMRVESVAWIAERRDLISGFFFLLCLNFYLQYAKEKKLSWFFVSLFMMMCGYASKPVLVVIPFVLIALDFWPLGRFGRGRENTKSLLLEKVPFLLLSLTLSAATLKLMQVVIIPGESITAWTRLVYMATSYTHHFFKAFWPFDPVLRDYPTTYLYTGAWFFAAVAMIFAISVAAWKTKDTVPAFLAGWFWYLSALFPVCGIVPFGMFLVADHYTYLPHMGITVMAVWGAAHLVERSETAGKILAGAGFILVLCLAVLSSVDLSYWKDGLTFFTRQFELEENSFASKELGIALASSNRAREAIGYFEKAHSLQPRDPDNSYNLALALLESGERDRAAVYLEKTIELKPEMAEARFLYAGWLLEKGRIPEAIMQYRELLRMNPEDKGAREALARLGR